MSTAQVFSFFRPAAPRDWAPQDIAEFYRVEGILIQAGLRVTSTRGLSDEGDPWFVFCREEDDEVIIHFARIDGSYVISAPAYCGNAVGRDFRSLVRGLIEQHPMLQLRPRPANLYLHPAALLVVLVATALVKLSPSAAAATPPAADATDAAGERIRGSGLPALPKAGAAPLSDVEQGTLIQAAINGALALTVVAGPVPTAGSSAIHAFDMATSPHVTVVDVSPLDIFTKVAPGGTGSMTPVVPPHDMAAHTWPADVTPPTALLATLPADAIVAVGSAGSSLPPLPAVAFDPAAAVTYVSLSGLASIPDADKALLQTLGLTGNVSYVNQVPQVFSDVVKVGSHTEVQQTTAPTSHTAADTSHEASSGTTAPASDAAPQTAPAAGSNVAANPVSPPAPVAPVPDLHAVIAAVHQFQSVAIHPVLLVTAHAAIFYDEAAITSELSAVKSITYDFGDGYSISLVGLPAELAYAVHAAVHV